MRNKGTLSADSGTRACPGRSAASRLAHQTQPVFPTALSVQTLSNFSDCSFRRQGWADWAAPASRNTAAARLLRHCSLTGLSPVPTAYLTFSCRAVSYPRLLPGTSQFLLHEASSTPATVAPFSKSCCQDLSSPCYSSAQHSAYRTLSLKTLPAPLLLAC